MPRTVSGYQKLKKLNDEFISDIRTLVSDTADPDTKALVKAKWKSVLGTEAAKLEPQDRLTPETNLNP